jgi:hypothetical protein
LGKTLEKEMSGCAHEQPLIEGADDEYIINSITIVSFNLGLNLGNFKKIGRPIRAAH